MVKVIVSSAADGEVELIITAARFFLDRLVPAAQQKKLTLNVEVTDKPGRKPIAVKYLVGSSGLFGWKPPCHFDMTISVAAGTKDGLEVAANEIVHIAQAVTCRLKICLKSRKVNGKREDAYSASWVNGKFAFIDMTPRDARLWEAEAHLLKTQLVNEFMAWSAGSLKKLPTQKPKKNIYGLYAIRQQNIALPVSIPPRIDLGGEKIPELSDVVELLTDKPVSQAEAPAIDQPENDQPTLGDPAPIDPNRISPSQAGAVPILQDEPQGTAPQQKITQPSDANLPAGQFQIVNHLEIDSDEFKIEVNVPRLGIDRMLDSLMLHCKLNELLERGLIPHDAARTAFRQAQKNRVVR